MKNKYARLSNGIQNIAFWGLTVIALMIGLYLSYSAMRYSYYSGIGAEPIHIIPDSLLRNGISVMCAVLFTFALNFLLQKYIKLTPRKGYLFLGICCLLFFVSGCIWTSQNPYYPVGDQISTTAAAHYNLSGNFSMLYSGGYLGIYSQQKGLTFLYEIFFTLFGDFCYHVVEKFHVLAGVITMIFGYLFLEDISKRYLYRILYCLLLLFCAPFMILMPYAYGDIFSISACTVLFWAINRYLQAFQAKYVAIACFMSVFAVFTRTNSWIILIAAAIALTLCSLERKSIRPVLLAACMILTTALSWKLLCISYEVRSGIEDTKGTPAILWVAMGLQDNLDGPGIYNHYNRGTFEAVDFDREAAAAIGWQEVKDQVNRMISSPTYTKLFFKQKTQMQWIEPLYETLQSTGTFDSELPIPQWIYEIYHGKLHDPLFRFANAYQNIVYLALVAFLIMLPRNKKSFSVYIPLISLVGGFLFSIIWENQCRYVLPYYLFILPYVPVGLCYISDGTSYLISKLRALMSRRNISTKSQDSEAA